MVARYNAFSSLWTCFIFIELLLLQIVFMKKKIVICTLFGLPLWTFFTPLVFWELWFARDYFLSAQSPIMHYLSYFPFFWTLLCLIYISYAGILTWAYGSFILFATLSPKYKLTKSLMILILLFENLLLIH